MKLLSIICGLLLCIAFASASTDGLICKYGEISYTRNSICSCVPYYSCHDISLNQYVVSTWTDSVTKQAYTQYNVVITNHLGLDVKNLIIGSDSSLCLRDSTSIWNIQLLSNGNLILPTVQPSINKDSTFTFGFILKGTQRANLFIKAVVY
ncbi:hypothetical protein RB653_007471 [Dictyostelium firmibasis]|uniref:Carbohydrate binding domain-containing protein n=1 Tax=Dictyostelium firmibasis TaxID=79012 RepID=A0AAN7U195_9MYCE